MAIIVTSETRLVVQGITGREGSFHAIRNRDYGTRVVAGVTPGKRGQDVQGVPVEEEEREEPQRERQGGEAQEQRPERGQGREGVERGRVAAPPLAPGATNTFF